MSELLTMTNISKSFPGVKALDNVSISVKSGSVHALMGENGAGKSTLMKCLFGVYERDSGIISVDGNEVNFKSSAEALRGGVAMVHQELNQALKLTVSENMWLGRFPRLGGWMPFIDTKRMKRDTEELLSKLGIPREECVMIGNDTRDDFSAHALGIPVFVLTECLINTPGVDLSKYPHGGFLELKKYIENLN